MCHLNWLFLGELAQAALSLSCRWSFRAPGGEEQLQPECPAALLLCCRAALLSLSPDFFHQKLLRDCSPRLRRYITFSSGLEGEGAASPVGDLWAMPDNWGRPIWSFTLLRLGMVFDIENLEMSISERKKAFCTEVKRMFLSLRISYHQTISKYLSSTWPCWGIK